MKTLKNIALIFLIMDIIFFITLSLNFHGVGEIGEYYFKLGKRTMVVGVIE